MRRIAMEWTVNESRIKASFEPSEIYAHLILRVVFRLWVEKIGREENDNK
jgi:hypothetical protein